ncbi:DNA-binding protein D-ETS-4 [Octopus sinensis]|uniref:DNA-binding protein D-ETS-4 n=1 Tax=Octopus sinensis TaxID=2607531 RepID=A0A6P7TWD8_9MOLL|nr:DNA-binding protein D-ETS-4 [Octopus sinensis]
MPQSRFPAIDLYQNLTEGTLDSAQDYYLAPDPILPSYSIKLEPSLSPSDNCLMNESYRELLVDPLMPQCVNPVANCQDHGPHFMNDNCSEILNLDEIKLNAQPNHEMSTNKSDPRNWSENEIKQWISSRLDLYSIPVDSIDWPNINGAMMFTMSRDQLRFQLQNKAIADILFNDMQKLIYDVQIADAFFYSPSSSNSSSDFGLHQTMSDSCKTEQFRMLNEYMNMVSFPNDCLSGSDEGNDSNDSSDSSTDSSELSSSITTIDKKTFDPEPLYKEQKPRETPQITKHKQNIHLWQFLKELLLQGDKYIKYIKWLDPKQGVFKIEDSSNVARLWGERKNRPAMNYDKLSRSIRQYYNKGIIKKTEKNRRLVYKFCPDYL